MQVFNGTNHIGTGESWVRSIALLAFGAVFGALANEFVPALFKGGNAAVQVAGEESEEKPKAQYEHGLKEPPDSHEVIVQDHP